MTDSIGAPTPGILVEQSSALPPDRVESLRAAAQDLEAAFIAEMLKQAKFGEARGAFGGGVGEEQFASFMRAEHAAALAARGGIGLAESIFEALVARSEGEP